jgi:hypothetical protein
MLNHETHEIHEKNLKKDDEVKVEMVGAAQPTIHSS